MRQRGFDVVVTREPGGTPLGEQLREILLNQPMSIGTEALLMFAARLEHIEQVIKPALHAGKWVISDRFSDASFAYQGGGRGLDWDKLSRLEQWVHPDLQPDLTLFFDVPVEIAQQRLRSPDNTRPNNVSLDRSSRNKPISSSGCAGYHRHPAARSAAVIDGAQPLEKVKQQLEHHRDPMSMGAIYP